MSTAFQTAAPTAHVWLDEQGRAWIDDTNVKVIEVAEEFLARREPPEMIQSAHPHLSLAQIHAALAYYYDHRAAFDEAIAKGMSEYEAAQIAQGDSPTLKKARALGLRP